MQEGPASPIIQEGPTNPIIQEGPASSIIKEGPANPIIQEGPGNPIIQEGPANNVFNKLIIPTKHCECYLHYLEVPSRRKIIIIVINKINTPTLK